MSKNTYGLTPDELFRLQAAYGAIRSPSIRKRFLENVESWAQEQWHVVDEVQRNER